MEVIIRNSQVEASFLVARLIVETVKKKPDAVLGLATGRTMETVYQKLCQLAQEQAVSFSRVTTFNLDEYIGLSPDHPNSYRQYMEHHLFRKLAFNPSLTFVPIGTSTDIEAECRNYEERIAQVGGIDLQLLGLGREGHIGFNEPLSSLCSRTRAKSLAPGTIAQNQTLFSDPRQMPRRAITMGVGTILESKRCIMLVTGKEKAPVLAKAVEGPLTAMCSASALQLHPCCQVVVDKEAASELQHTEYYQWIFENEPEWEPYRGSGAL